MSRKSCKDCVFWDRVGEGDARGICRNLGPQPPAPEDPTNTLARWVTTLEVSWCAEFEGSTDPDAGPLEQLAALLDVPIEILRAAVLEVLEDDTI